MTDALEILERRAAEARARRAAFQFATRMGDELRQHFPGARVTYATEGGRTVGAPGPEGVPMRQPDPVRVEKGRR